MATKRRSWVRRLAAVCVLASASAPSLAHAADPVQPAPKLGEGQHFTIDPVTDIVITTGGAGFSIMLGMVLSTGEIVPTAPGNKDNLLAIDRFAVTQTIDDQASRNSSIALYGVIVPFAVVDTVLSGFRDGWDAALVDGVLYAESAALTLTLTDITKIAVRRPRPIDYLNPSTTSTDMELSFFSGHASTAAALSATASYLAFSRSPGSVRAWLTLGGGTLLTSFVGYERVRSGAHFPTDVITGAFAGAAIGVLVPHLHRHHEEPPPVWVGYVPASFGTGGTLTMGGRF